MKTWFKNNRNIILINLVIIFLIFFFSELAIYLNSPKELPFLMLAGQTKSPHMSFYYEKLNKDGFHDINNFPKDYQYILRPEGIEYKLRKPMGLEFKNEPVILFGCSFAWGEGLRDDQTFQYKLSQLMKRPIYNRAMSAWGVQHILYQLKQDDFYSMIPKPQYVIYIYFPGHVQRMYKFDFIYDIGKKYNYNYLKYNYHSGKLSEEKRLQFVPYSRILNWHILPYIAREKEKNTKKSFNLFKTHLLECRKEMDNHWGRDVKFIILDYNIMDNLDIFDSENVEELKKDNIYVIKTSDLTDINLDSEPYYISEDDHHPGEGAWNLIAPLLAEKIKKMGL